MRYTKKTLEELKKTMDRVARISQEISGSVAFRDHLEARSRNNSLSQEQRQAAEGLRDKIDLFTNLGLSARDISSKIQKQIDGNAQNPDDLEVQIDRFIDTLQQNTGQVTAAADAYFLWDDHDKTPEFSDPVWPMYKLTREFDEAGKNLDVLQRTNGIHKYKEIDTRLEEEMTYLSAMSCDGIDLTQVPDTMQDAKAEADEAKNRYRELQSDDEKERWKEKQATANRRISEIPGEIQKLEEERKAADTAAKNDAKDLEEVKRARGRYDDIRRQIVEAGENEKKLSADIDGLQQELSSKTEKTDKANNTYRMGMEAYEHRAGGHAIDFFKPYVESKERELQWKKVRELAGKLGDVLWEDTTALNSFVSGIENRSGKLSGKEQEITGSRRKAPLSEENGKRLDRIGELVAQMMRMAPDKNLLNDLLVPKAPVTDAGSYLDELNKGLDQLIESNRKDYEGNVLYQNTQKKKEEVSKKKEEYGKNADNLQKDNFGKKKEKKAKQKKNKGLAVEIAKEDMGIAIDAVNTDELDFLIEDHVNTAMEQAEREAKLDELKEKRNDSIKLAGDLNKNLEDLRRDCELDYAPHLLGKAFNGQGGQDNLFGYLENVISDSVAKNQNSRDNEIPQKIERLKNELNERKAEADRYSLDSYKKALVDAQLDSEKKSRRYTQLQTINRHLNIAKDLYNDKTAELRRASDSLSKEREVILEGINAFLRDFDKNKKTGHGNSDEYETIKTALEAFTNDNTQELTPERFKQMLGVLKQSASAYKEKKNKQWFHWRPSGQRKFRLNQADNIERFCDEHTALIDSMNLNEATRQEIRDFNTNPPADNLDAGQFRTKAQEMKAQYDNKISTFKNIMLETKNAGAQRFDGNEQMTDAARKDMVINALVNNEVEKELWNTDPEKESFDKHVLDLQTIRNTAKQNIEKTDTEFINKVIEDSKAHPEMSGADIAKRKRQQEAGRKYRDFTSYDQNLQEAVYNNAGNEMNRQVNNNRAMAPQ
ncbi:MAG: hypothetical protein K6G16_03000 [Lachnospiraceae bacterium]|nr:hypothetical protein [Lachnospiraceae bacterium]